MHDIGKIGIPDGILLKPGKLTPDEWQIMKRHTVFGARILEGFSNGFMYTARTIAMTHHERWDGSGYPRGLKGTDIPLVGRITAIADVFDALTSKRPYKEAFPLEKAFGIIQEGIGSHFDPEIGAAFFAAKDKVAGVRKRFADRGESLLRKLVGNGAPSASSS
jgi:putative two-component system response regulator